MIRITDLPDDVPDWAPWLERQLVELDVQDLVSELQALTQREPDESITLDSVLGETATQVAENGLSGLSESQLRSLIQHPHVLVEIREWLFENGGDYWLELSNSARHSDSASAALAKARERATEHGADSAQPVISAAKPVGRRPLLGVLAIAASTIIAISLWQFGFRDQDTQIADGGGWGFDAKGLLESDVSAGEYLQSLSDAGKQWSNKQPVSKAALVKRLAQFSAGCQKLIDAPHKQLQDEDRQWLVGKCKDWKEKIDGARDSLVAGDLSFEEAKIESDQIVNKLVIALSERSKNA